MDPIDVHPEVDDALRAGRPVVALESAVITTGIPKAPVQRAPAGADGWDTAQATNLELARLLERTVRDAGAVPATVAVIEGALRIGLDEASLAQLADEGAPSKVSARDLALALAEGRTAGTTVSATLLACRRPACGAIPVLATGGIGGVHRHWTDRPDISTDLRQLASTPVCVVASGAKSVLDVTATLEALESLGVPVIAFGTDRFPQFYSAGSDTVPAPTRADRVEAVAAICRIHWNTLGSTSGILLANPIDEEFALPPADLERATREAEAESRRRGVAGSRLTPFLIDEIVRRTGGRALDANIALLAGNARLAANVARALAG